MAAMSLEQFSNNYRDTIDRLYSISNASAWQVSRSSFATALWKSFERRFGADTITLTRAEAVRFLDSLHVTDLALAIGCRDGDAGAWRHLVATYRAPVDAFARAVLATRRARAKLRIRCGRISTACDRPMATAARRSINTADAAR